MSYEKEKLNEMTKLGTLVAESNERFAPLSGLDLERWIIAHEKADVAFAAYQKCLEWRANQNVDELLTNPVSTTLGDQISCGKAVILPEHVQDDKGRPVMVCNPTKHDKKTKLKDTVEHMVYCLEMISKMCDKNGVKDMCVVLDLDSFGFSDMDYSIAKAAVRILVNYYPERLGILYFINTPPFFHGCYKIIQGWLYPRTRDKIKFVDGKISTGDFIQKESLPPELWQLSTPEANTETVYN